MKSIVIKVIQLAVIAILTAGLIVGNVVLFSNAQAVSSALCPPIINEEELANTQNIGQELAKEMVQEGTVLLRNENDCLPLDKANTKVNVFGWRSVDWVYGAEGTNSSGGVVPERFIFDENVDFIKALTRYGIETNTELQEMYERYFEPNHLSEALRDHVLGDYMYLVEPDINDKAYYSDALLANAKKFSDTAFVVISRNGGEGWDAPKSQQKNGPGATNDTARTYLQISEEEEALLTYVGANFENVIVVLNTEYAMELGFLETIPGLDACLNAVWTGTRGASALPSLIWGDVSPSAKTVDTYAYDARTNPTYAYAGKATTFTNGDPSICLNRYIDYTEGIYVGYKWYETADAEGVWSNVDNDYGKGYEGVVQYPFGYGLSYTTFGWDIESVTVDGEEVSLSDPAEITEKSKIAVNVRVTNTGDVAGKDVVEAFVTVPYTDGGIEKSHVSLTGFAKTDTIEPGKDEVVTVNVDAFDFASYDCYDENDNDFAGYELENGEYSLKLMTDSHTVKNTGADGAGSPAIIKFNVAETIKIAADPVTGAETGNLFTGEDAIDGVSIDGGAEYISRENFPDPLTTEIAPARAATQEMIDHAIFDDEWANEWDNAKTDAFGDPVKTDPVTWGKDSGLRLTENGSVTDLGYRLGSDWDDPDWGKLLDQLTTADCKLVFNKSYGVPAVSSIGMTKRKEYDGPSQIKGFIMGSDVDRGTGYPCPMVLAQSWSEKLAYKHAMTYGQEMKTLGVAGVWASGVNIHRTPFGGRNFEYYSEDSYLSARMVVQFSRGLANRGRYCYLKHFVINDQETNRSTVSTFCTEQALREIYLKPFRAAIVEGGCMGVMTTYGRIGSVSTTSSEALLTGILRREWKFRGSVITDYTDNNGMSIDAQMRRGGNLGMGVSLNTNGVSTNYDNAPARVQNRMREAMKEVIYTWLRQQYVEQQYMLDPDEFGAGYASSYASWNWWQPFIVCVDVVDAIAMCVWIFFIFIGKDRKEKNVPPEGGAPAAA